MRTLTYMDNTSEAETEALIATEKHMAKGTETEDDYWKLFDCVDQVNSKIVQAYRLGFSRGYAEGKGNLAL